MAKPRLRKLAIILVVVGGLVLLGKPILVELGEFLVVEDGRHSPADAAVVLATGVDYTARLIEAARLYDKGLVKKVVIDGDRKSEALKQLETRGFVEPCRWSVNYVAALEFLKVKERDIVVIDAPDAFDTVSEARITGTFLVKHGLTRLIITTSKFHTRRAAYIWRHSLPGKFNIQVAAAADDPFDPKGWWKKGPQIRQLLAEYGGWLYYWGKRLRNS